MATKTFIISDALETNNYEYYYIGNEATPRDQDRETGKARIFKGTCDTNGINPNNGTFRQINSITIKFEGSITEYATQAYKLQIKLSTQGTENGSWSSIIGEFDAYGGNTNSTNGSTWSKKDQDLTVDIKNNSNIVSDNSYQYIQISVASSSKTRKLLFRRGAKITLKINYTYNIKPAKPIIIWPHNLGDRTCNNTPIFKMKGISDSGDLLSYYYNIENNTSNWTLVASNVTSGTEITWTHSGTALTSNSSLFDTSITKRRILHVKTNDGYTDSDVETQYFFYDELPSVGTDTIMAQEAMANLAQCIINLASYYNVTINTFSPPNQNYEIQDTDWTNYVQKFNAIINALGKTTLNGPSDKDPVSKKNYNDFVDKLQEC